MVYAVFSAASSLQRFARPATELTSEYMKELSCGSLVMAQVIPLSHQT